MATSPLVPVEVYLTTSYRPDCDFVDGEVLERNAGELPHGRLQGLFLWLFRSHESDWGVEAVPEQRVQVGPERYRVPDVTVISRLSTDERIVHTPPVLCIEILSSEDRMSRIRERVMDYASMGVVTTWVVDPWRWEAYASDRKGVLQPVADRLQVPGTAIEVAVKDLWAELERLRVRTKDVKNVRMMAIRAGRACSSTHGWRRAVLCPDGGWRPSVR